MNYATTVTGFAVLARDKVAHLRNDPTAFFVLAMMAGAYVGFGILLIFSVGQGVNPDIRPVVMGASFGIALMLVIFAGSELFTGHTMYMAQGVLVRTIRLSDLGRCWGISWVANLCGASILGAIFVYGGGGVILAADTNSFLHVVAEKKMQSGPGALVLNGILCNWLVCLAIWMAARTTSDIAKIALIWFCLYAFIAAGFEHSVANMTIFSVALLSEHGAGISVGGAAYNLLFVTIGNTIAGAGIMGAGYWVAAGRPSKSSNKMGE
ncbi:formate/nitrite transporter family protein [Tateyamaria sp.]|uniref:formate/nitrite transporter family protein n=1 Tax=Tateyamaria sp. TaxID=1929288 RepID=UPI00329F0823